MVTYTGFYSYRIVDIDNKKVSKLFVSKENAIKYCKDNDIKNYFIDTVKI